MNLSSEEMADVVGQGVSQQVNEQGLQSESKIGNQSSCMLETSQERLSSPSETLAAKLKLRQENVSLLSLQLEELKVGPSPTAVPTLAINKIITFVTQHYGKKDKDNAKKKLPPRDLLTRRIQNWAGYLYPKIREIHLKQLETLQQMEFLEKIMIFQTAEWSKVSAINPRNSEETHLGYWGRQLEAFLEEFNKYKANFEKEYDTKCMSISHLMHGIGFGDSRGIWPLIDAQFGGYKEKLLEHIDLEELSLQ